VITLLKIAICDDNIPITSEIERMLLQIMKQDYISMEIAVYFDGESLCKKIEQGEYYDLIYLDIKMSRMDGIKTAQFIRLHDIPSLLIYISAYDTYFEQLFEVEPFRFLSKPIDHQKFYNYFQDAYKKIQSRTQFFTFSFHQKYMKLPVSEIIYLESRGRDILIHTQSTTNRFLGKLDEIEAYANEQNWNFIRIHQSYLINSYHISALTLSKVNLSTGCSLHVGPKFQKTLRSKYFQILEDL
jgi:DNA-binding LytR/AlgR family response regulator